MALQYASLTIPPARAVNAAAAGSEVRQLAAAADRACVPLVYGEDRLGGLVLNVLPTTAGGTTVLVQLLWCHACDSINDFRWNDQALPGGVTAVHYTGSQTTADASVVAAFAAQGITYTETLAGFAYSVVTFPASLFDGSLSFSSRVRGRRLYDPRLDSTAGGSGAQRLANPSTWTWSANPVLALADFVSNTLYGAGEPVDWSTIAAAANHADANVGSPAEPRRRIGVSFIEELAVEDLAEALRAYAGCWLFPGSAGVRFLADQDVTDSATYTHAAGQIASIEPLALRDLGNSPTAVEVLYTDTSRVPYRQGSAIAQLSGAGTTLPWRLSQVSLPGIQRYSQAYREAVERLNKLTLQDVSTTVELFDDGIRHDVGDVIRITHPIGLTLRRMRITDVLMTSLGRWRLPLVEHDPAVYSTAVATLTLPADTPRVIGANTAVPWDSLTGRPADSEILNSFVPQSRGAMNADPACEKPTAWEIIGSVAFGTTSNGQAVGRACLVWSSTAGENSMAYSAEVIPVSPAKRYSLRARLWVAPGNARNMYVVVRMFRANQTELIGADTGWGGSYAGYTFGGLPTPDTFAEYGADFGAGTALPMPSDVAYIRVGVWGQYQGGSDTSVRVAQIAQDIRLTEVTAVRAAQAAADAAASVASGAATNATAAVSTLATMRSNGFLDASEKPSVIRQWNAIVGEQASIYQQGTDYGLTALRNAYEAAYLALSAYLGALTPGWSDTTQDTPIIPATDQARWLDYYNARQALLNGISAEAGKRALWAQVGGAGKPSDNATRDVAFVPHGGTVDIVGNTLIKANTGNSDFSWDSAVRSAESYSGGAYVSFSPGTTDKRFMVGLNTAADLSDPGFSGIDYAMYCEIDQLYAWESGSGVGPLAGYVAGDVLAVVYDGYSIKYLKNGAVIRSVVVNITAPLYMDSTFYARGARADRVVFGPLSAVRDIVTAQMTPGAVTGGAGGSVTTLGEMHTWPSTAALTQFDLTPDVSADTAGVVLQVRADVQIEAVISSADVQSLVFVVSLLEVTSAGAVIAERDKCVYSAPPLFTGDLVGKFSAGSGQRAVGFPAFLFVRFPSSTGVRYWRVRITAWALQGNTIVSPGDGVTLPGSSTIRYPRIYVGGSIDLDVRKV